MKVKAWLKEVAYLDEFVGMDDEIYQTYYSKFDNSYICFAFDTKKIKYLADRDITVDLSHGVGFSPVTNKWFGWSHRAIFGFTIGSEVSEGDCGYNPKNKEDFIKNTVNFWTQEDHINMLVSDITDYDFTITWKYSNKIPNKTLRGENFSIRTDFPDTYGKGVWVAETLEDAKQMAIDFNESVS